ncbi:isocitrate lyase/PEP mutase family protein [Microbaculum marinum]|uniref:Isocitrate lyase/PEP mutase family protein n=1 Tax=Microbaculum marinum TaxID=1764581 RepID=A0AAW9RRI7_9HYPH
MPRTTIRAALAQEHPLVCPLAHDALSASMIEKAGFKAFAIGGSAMLAARYALPDIGLIGLSDMVAGIRDIASASALPFFADGDDGYGGNRNVARMIEAYEAAGVGAILIEDQNRDSKQQRADRAKHVCDDAVIEGKLRTAMAARSDKETFIVGRTDAYGPLGLSAAIRRAGRYLELGVDGVFVAGLTAESEYEEVGRALDGAFLSAAMFGGAATPWLTVSELRDMGYSQVSFPAFVISRAVAAMQDGLVALRAHGDGTTPIERPDFVDSTRPFLDDAVALAKWNAYAGT